MKPRVYIETTIPSYLTAWQSPQLVMAANQQVTREWWESRRTDFELYCSHIANAVLRGKIADVCQSFGWRCPTICTPQEMLTR